MKKYLALISLVLFAIVAIAQERTVSEMTFDRNPLAQHFSEWSYDGTSSDVFIPTTRDTIAIPYNTKKASPYDFDFTFTFNPRTTADTTITVLIQGRNSENVDWTTISTNVSSAVTTDGVTLSISSGKTATVAAAVDFLQQTLVATKDTISVAQRTITYTDKTRYRYLRALCILTGDDSVGTGVELIKAELKLWED